MQHAAALAHDIGNPPFGHSGEKAIGEFFISGEGQHYKEELTGSQYQDLCDFEGNANGFKIVTQSRAGREGGLRLSYATLGAFTKYPKASLPKKPTKHIADKKYGFFQTEKDFMISVGSPIGNLNSSNALCFIIYDINPVFDEMLKDMGMGESIEVILAQKRQDIALYLNPIKSNPTTTTTHNNQNTNTNTTHYHHEPTI